MRFLTLFLFLYSITGFSQDFDYYFLGDTSDVLTAPNFGICLMGGATEDDNGSSWFLEKADGGNVVVIRASGSDGYNDYFYNQLGVSVQSVETIVFNSASASQDAFVQRRISNAEAIWIAGGDQFIYEDFWKGTAIQDLLNDHLNVKGYPIGGTSAGMAILSEYYFNAANGTVTSTEAMNDPLSAEVSIEKNFIAAPFLLNTINDTHYDNPDRRGRHAVFLAHLLADNNSINFGIGAEEYVAICIDPTGIATVYGQYPTYEDHAYFLRTNCDAEPPSSMEQNTPMTWVGNPEAIAVCKVEARSDGSSTFDLNEWKDVNHGTWEGWNIDGGSLSVINSSYTSCGLGINNNNEVLNVKIYPNPTSDYLMVQSPTPISSIELMSLQGKTLTRETSVNPLYVGELNTGTYIAKITLIDGAVCFKRFLVSGLK